jgi:hypothetical protein
MASKPTDQIPELHKNDRDRLCELYLARHPVLSEIYQELDELKNQLNSFSDEDPANFVGFRHYRGAWTAQDKAWIN